MSHKSKVSLNEQLRQEFFQCLVIGRSRDLDKKNGVDTKRYIYSWGSYKTYFKVGKRYLAWCKRQGFRCRTLADCRPYCDLWLQENIQRGLSAYTLKLYTATLSKIYSTSSDAFIKTPTRHRKDITRSRMPAVRDKNFNPELHQNTINFLLSTGLRRNEANSLRGSALFIDSDGADSIDGTGQRYKLRITSGSKGGRPREVLIIGDVENVVAMMKAAGDGKVFPNKLPTNLDVHNLRARHACLLYKYYHDKYGGPKDRKDKFFPRGELAHKAVYSKKLMRLVSEQLGHSRIGIFSSSYAYYLTQEDLK